MFLPEIMRIRIPKVVYKASEDGYNLVNIYNKCDQYTESYSISIILVESTQGEIFGAFVDAIPSQNSNKFVGTTDAFVFTLHPSVNKYPATNLNQQIVLFADNYFAVGFGDEGPALRVDDKLKQGRTYKSETFGNIPLTQGKGPLATDFVVAKLEIL